MKVGSGGVAVERAKADMTIFTNWARLTVWGGQEGAIVKTLGHGCHVRCRHPIGRERPFDRPMSVQRSAAKGGDGDQEAPEQEPEKENTGWPDQTTVQLRFFQVFRICLATFLDEPPATRAGGGLSKHTSDKYGGNFKNPLWETDAKELPGAGESPEKSRVWGQPEHQPKTDDLDTSVVVDPGWQGHPPKGSGASCHHS